MRLDVTWSELPFGHVIIDRLWDPDRLARVAAEFPPPADPAWKVYQEEHERGKQEGSNAAFWGPETAKLLGEMQGMAPFWSQFIDADHLIGDTNGGGMHMTGPGGRLAMHRDFSFHPQTGLERRLNMLVFLNPVWKREWGGVLYLGEHREVEVMPITNRTVVFECSATSWHGHPEPVAPGHWRKSLACYFYSQPRGTVPHHGTAWL